MRTKSRLAFVVGVCSVWGICIAFTGCHSLHKSNSFTHTTCPSCELPPNADQPHNANYHQGPGRDDIIVDGPDHGPGAGAGPLPHELFPVSHPPYTVAPPDRLLIDAIRLIPRPPYRMEPLESMLVDVKGTLAKAPISGQFTITPEGKLNLGYDYGSLVVQGLTLEQIQNALQRHLSGQLKDPQVRVALTQFRAQQQIRGEHLVRPDGTISLGMYGYVYVAGMTMGQIKTVIERHLSHYFINPQVSVDVLGYNSKFYYVIADGAGLGQQVRRFPITGNERVLDAIAKVQGLLQVSSIRRIWVARPSPLHIGCSQILPVDWRAVTESASTATNYQLFPGDRVYIDSDCLTRFTVWMNKILMPFERMLGVTFLGASIANTIGNGNQNNNNGGLILVP